MMAVFRDNFHPELLWTVSRVLCNTVGILCYSGVVSVVFLNVFVVELHQSERQEVRQGKDSTWHITVALFVDVVGFLSCNIFRL